MHFIAYNDNWKKNNINLGKKPNPAIVRATIQL